MSDLTLATKRRHLIDGEIVTIKVPSNADNENIQCITFHESTLRGKSRFFDTALSKQWKEGQQRTIEMPDDESEIVYAYRDFLYSGSGTVQPSIEKPKLSWTWEEAQREYLFLAKILVFAEKVQDDSLYHAAIESFVDIADKMFEADGNMNYTPPRACVVETIYSGTPETSSARKLMVDIFSTNAGPGMMGDEERPGFLAVPEFLCDVAHELLLQGNSTLKRLLKPRVKEYFKAEGEDSEDLDESVEETGSVRSGAA